MTIAVEDEHVQQALQRAAKRLAGQINIPGFRKGKAPYPVVMRAVGEHTLYEEMFKEQGEQWVKEALQEADLVPFRQVGMSDLQLKPLSFKVTVPLAPLVELGEYRDLRVPFAAPPVPESQVDQVLEGFRQRYSVIEPAGDGPAGWGHIAVLDLAAIADDGQPLNFSSLAENGSVSLPLDEQRDALWPGFSANIIGMSAGEVKTFDLRAPDDVESAALRGQTVHFSVRLNELKRLYIPPLDDTLAQTVGNYDTLDQLRAAVRQTLEQTSLAQAKAAYADTCIERLAESARIEYPPVLVEEELDKLIEEIKERLSAQKMSLEELLNIKKQSLEDYRAEMKPRAAARLKQTLAFSAFLAAEKLTADEQDGEKLTARAIARLTAICRGEAPEAQTVNESSEPPAGDAPGGA